MTTLTWTSATSGFWTTATNWSPNQVPGAGDTALVTLPGAYLISLTSNAQIADLTLSDAAGAISIGGSLGATQTIDITAGSLSVAGTVTATQAFDNAGMVSIANGGTLIVGDFFNTGTVLDNGTLRITGNTDGNSISRISATGQPLVVTGTIDNVGGTLDGTSLSIFPSSVQLGTLVGGGVINLSSSIVATDLKGVTGFGTLIFAGTNTVENGLTLFASTGTGAGTLHFDQFGDGSILEFVGNQHLANAHVDSFGTFIADNTLTIDSNVDFNMAARQGFGPAADFAGAGSVRNEGTIVASAHGFGPHNGSDAILRISVADFQNLGVVDMRNESGPGAPGGASVITISAANFNNHFGGTIELAPAALYVSASTAFTNDGIIRTTDASPPSPYGGFADIAALVTGSGTIEIASGGEVMLESAVASTQTIDFTTGGTLALTAPSFVGALIEGLDVGDLITLGVSATALSYTSGDLKMQSATGTFDLAITGETSLSDFIINTGSASTTIQLACFAQGTRFATPSGPVAVEELREGDLVSLADGSQLPVVWLGHRHVDCRRHPEPHAVWPIRVRRGAFGRSMPQHDLYLSPDHAVFVRDVLIPIKYLVNGSSIAQVPRDTITYWHVELPCHAVLLAENLPSESLVPGAERAAFANGGGVTTLHPDFSTRLWEAHGCAPLVVTGPVLEEARAELRRRAIRPPRRARAA